MRMQDDALFPAAGVSRRAHAGEGVRCPSHGQLCSCATDTLQNHVQLLSCGFSRLLVTLNAATWVREFSRMNFSAWY